MLGFGKTYTVTGTAGARTASGADQGHLRHSRRGQRRAATRSPPATARWSASPRRSAISVRCRTAATGRRWKSGSTITTTPKVEGAWGWIQHDDGRWAMDWRTKDYWPAGTKVHVDAKLYGVKFDDTVVRCVRHHQRLHHRPESGRLRRRRKFHDRREAGLHDERPGLSKTVATYPASFGRGTTTVIPSWSPAPASTW